MVYEHIRNPQLPWGYWLQTRDGVFVDEGGREWRSVREAFWVGRLGMRPLDHDYGREKTMHEELERLTAVLAAQDRRILLGRESATDMFDGSHAFERFHSAWTWGFGLTDEQSLTVEGRAVLLMLVATRPYELGRLPVGPDAMRAIIGADAGVEAREQWFAEIDAFARDLAFRFVRSEVGRSPCVELVGDDSTARMPTRRAFWSQGFRHEHDRDQLFAWLCERLDRWDDWGRLVAKRGAAEFQQHLVELLVLGSDARPAAIGRRQIARTPEG